MEYKGLNLLADACRRIADRNDWTLTIAGDGPLRAQVEATFGAMPQVDISMLRLLSEQEVDALLKSHDVVVCPYVEASQSGVIPEAAAFGVPSLVTPVGGLGGQIEGSRLGWQAAEVSAEAIAAAMVGITSDRQGYSAKSAALLDGSRHARAEERWRHIIAEAAGRT